MKARTGGEGLTSTHSRTGWRSGERSRYDGLRWNPAGWRFHGPAEPVNRLLVGQLPGFVVGADGLYLHAALLDPAAHGSIGVAYMFGQVLLHLAFAAVGVAEKQPDKFLTVGAFEHVGPESLLSIMIKRCDSGGIVGEERLAVVVAVKRFARRRGGVRASAEELISHQRGRDDDQCGCDP